MPFHWCNDETLMLMTMIPFIGFYFRKLHLWYHLKFGHKCHEKNCNDTHVEHDTSAAIDSERIVKIEHTLEEAEPNGINLHFQAKQIVNDYIGNKIS